MILGQKIETTQEKDIKKIDWSKTCTDYVVDATGIFTTCEKASVSSAKLFVYFSVYERMCILK